MSFSIVCSDVSFSWADGTVVFDGFDFTAGGGRTGLIGVNGSGKSTLLRLIAGELAPLSGAISVAGQVGYLPQMLPLDIGRPVDEVLGIAGIRTALRAIESGSVDTRHYDAIGDDWDVDERARATLDRLGLDHIGLDRRIGEISGGESVLLGLAGQLLRRPDVLLLDEPTNNLDLVARRRLYDVVRTWDGVMLIVSHDRELLELVDQIADLRDGEVRYFGGTLSAYEEVLEIEQEAARQAVRTAEADLKKQKRELIEAREKIDTRRKMGDKAMREKRKPMMVMKARKREAQVSAAKHRDLHQDRLDKAKERLDAKLEEVRTDDEIRVDLPGTVVPPGRTVLACEGVVGPYGLRYEDFELRGPERVALIGRNGSGKTTLLRMIAEQIDPVDGVVKVPVPVRYLPQRLDVLDDSLSLVENVRRFAPSASENAVRARLARFLFRGARVGQPAATLSGGERFRAVLAAMLLAEPAPQLLLLDEPTNNLDMASVEQLRQALAAYRGALIVAAHDLPFLRSIGVTRWIEL